MKALGLLTVATLAVGGCAITYPPLAAPTQELPPVATLPRAAANEGRIILDANGENARIMADGNTLCVDTPCAAVLARGAHRLTFFAHDDSTRFGDVDTVIADAPLVVRHAIGVRREHHGLRAASVVAFSLGVSLAALGAGVASIGFADDKHDAWRNVGSTMALTGLAGIALGVTFALAGRTQIWPGATRTWTISPSR